MAARIKADLEAIRALVVAVGVREAARQSGLSQNTLCSWSARYGWTQLAKQAQAQIAPSTAQSAAIKPADTLAAMLKNDAGATKIGFSKLARKVAEHGAKESVAGILKRSKAYRDVTAIAAQVHGWDSKAQPATGGFNLNILTGQAAVQVVTPLSDKPQPISD